MHEGESVDILFLAVVALMGAALFGFVAGCAALKGQP